MREGVKQSIVLICLSVKWKFWNQHIYTVAVCGTKHGNLNYKMVDNTEVRKM